MPKKKEQIFCEKKSICVDLNAFYMDDFFCAGAGGLAAAALQIQDEIFPYGYIEVQERKIILNWEKSTARNFFSGIRDAVFKINTYGQIQLTGSYITEPSKELSISLTKAYRNTFLQHGKSVTVSGEVKETLQDDDDNVRNFIYTKYTSFAHRDVFEKIINAIENNEDYIEGLSSWIYPGAVEKHFALNEKVSYRVEQVICGVFAIIGCFSYIVKNHSNNNNGGVLIVVTPKHLMNYAKILPFIKPQTKDDVYVNSIEDGVLSLYVSIKQQEIKYFFSDNCIDNISALYFKNTPWCEQQKIRVNVFTMHKKINEDIINVYQKIVQSFPVSYKKESQFRRFIAQNLVLEKRWYSGILKTREDGEVYKDFLNKLTFSFRKGYDLMMNSSLTNDEEKIFFDCVQKIFKMLLGKTANKFNKYDDEDIKDKFNDLKENILRNLTRCKVANQFRKEMTLLISKAGHIDTDPSAIHIFWKAINSTEKWKLYRDLTVVAIVCYSNKNNNGNS